VSALVADLAAEARAFTPLEAVAVLLAAAYLLLAIRENIWCWLCAAISTACYIALFIDAKLYMESLLNVFYFAMAVYGWLAWRNGGRERPALPVRRWPLGWHVAANAAVVALAGASGFWLAAHSDAAFPYIDSWTTYAAIWATFLVARKVLENWWYWFVIDAISVLLYWQRDLPLTTLLFVAYLLLIPVGLARWTRSWRAQPAR